ncbi:MAG TPA: PAC2 family protein [Thermoproteota archaeon]|nr:PAC2 family protein [Thermoproteota archaeon]
MSIFKEFVLNDPPPGPNIAVIAIPGTTMIGRHVVEKLMELTKATEFIKCVPQFLPDVLLGEDDGRPYVPGIDIYKSTKGKPDLLMATSNFQIGLTPAPYSYWMAEYLVRKAKQISSERIVVFDSTVKDRAGHLGTFYIASDSSSAKLAKDLKLHPIHPGKIPGLSPVIVATCRLYKIPAVGVISVMNDKSKPAAHINRSFAALVRLVDLQVP